MSGKIRQSLRATFYLLQCIFFSTIFLFRKKKKRETRYYFSLCAIFKDEARYFKEWIEYHKIVGVDHIYLYNNFSTDNYMEILRPYIDEDYVTLTEWPYEISQIAAYQDCYDRHRNQTFWLMFLDLDEFICPLKETDVRKWMSGYEKYPAVIMYWLMFGTNGKIRYTPDRLVIEEFTNSWDAIRNVGKQVLNTAYEPVKMYHHHIFCKLKWLGMTWRVPMVNELKKFIPNPGHEKCPAKNSIQINHYWSKCLDEYIRKINKGDMFDLKHDEIRKKMDFFYWHEYQNVAENKVIYRFLAELKMRLGNISVKFK